MYYKLNFHYSSTTPNYEWQFSNVPVIQELEYIIDSLIIGKVSQDRRKETSLWFRSVQINQFYPSENAACNCNWTKHIVIVRSSPMLSTNGFRSLENRPIALSLSAICKTIGMEECECNLDARLSNKYILTLRFAFRKRHYDRPFPHKCRCDIMPTAKSYLIN